MRIRKVKTYYEVDGHRTSITISDYQLDILNKLSKVKRITTNEYIRHAIGNSDYPNKSMALIDYMLYDILNLYAQGVILK